MVNINGIQKHKAFDMIMNRASGPYTTLPSLDAGCCCYCYIAKVKLTPGLWLKTGV